MAAERDEQRERLIEQAFGAFLHGAGGKRERFSRYLERIGLQDKAESRTRARLQVDAPAIEADADRIIAADRRRLH